MTLLSIVVPPLLSSVFPESLVWGAPQWIIPVTVGGCVLVLLVVFNYARQTAPAWSRVTGSILKLLAIALVAACILQPMIRAERPRPQANVLPILVDNSRSMQLRSASSGQTRGDNVKSLIDEDQAWRTRLSQDFDVRQYRFDARLDQLTDTDDLLFDGIASTLSTSLDSISGRLSGRPVGGLILLSDGNATDVSNDIDWSQVGFPVYPVVPADETDLDDLRITNVSVRQTDFETAPVTVSATAEYSGDQGATIARLVDAVSGQIVAEQNIKPASDGSTLKARFQFRPEETGVNFYQVQWFTESDRGAFAYEQQRNGEQGNGEQSESDSSPAPKSEWEATLANNRRFVAIDRRSGPYRILYVAGRPNWDFKFIRRALQEDVEIQLVGLLRIANKEPKFTFRDSKVNDTNPLFAGLGEDEEEAAEQYDEPVILRLGVKESEELSEGFPETAEELFAYQAIILDDLEPEFFSPDQMLLLRRFVAARGGGLLMLGGQESFSSRNFQNTPLGELSPVYAKRRSGVDDDESGSGGGSGPVRQAITREGLLQPWIRLRDDERSEQSRLKEMPEFITVNPVGDVKPGASELITLSGRRGQKLPGLVIQRFGKGRTAAMPIGDTWRWAMRRDRATNDDPAQAWRQMAHWLVGEVPRRVEITSRPPETPTAPVEIELLVRDESFLPLDNAEIKLQLTAGEDDPIDLSVRASDTTAGKYLAQYWSRRPGVYRVSAIVEATDGVPVGEAQTGWVSELASSEFRELKWNRTLLEQIAEQTGGEVVEADKLEAFAADLPNRKVPITETWVYPLWHQPWVITLAIACLCGEWTLRRWKGMR